MLMYYEIYMPVYDGFKCPAMMAIDQVSTTLEHWKEDRQLETIFNQGLYITPESSLSRDNAKIRVSFLHSTGHDN